MMHIAHMIDSLGVGGAEKLLVTFAAMAQAYNIKLTVVSLHHDNKSPIPDELQALGAHVRMFPARKLLDPKRIWHIARFLSRVHIDVLHTHLTYANIIGTMTGRLVGLPVVTTLHNTETGKRAYEPIRQQLETWALRYGAHRVVAVGHIVAEAHRHRMRGRPIRVIPNTVVAAPPFSSAERAALRMEMVGNPSRLILISVGRLSPQKGFPDLLAAFATLRKTHPAAALVIVGGGTLCAELEEQVAALKLDGQVVLLGVRSDVPRLLAASDVYVSASHWEGLPLTILEAMAAGLPIVATRVGDVPQVVIDGTGILVPPQAPDRLAMALRSLLDEPTQRHAFGLAAQAHVARHYNAATWADQLLALYTELSPTLDTIPSLEQEDMR